jgi:TRAP-type C4-dicarboxylate transport system substrate-binding protein
LTNQKTHIKEGKIMKKCAFMVVAVFFLSILIIGGADAAGPIKLRVGHDLPPFTSPGKGIDAWAKAVNKRTEGRVIVEVYPANTLTEQKGAVEVLQAGIADGYMVSISAHRPLFPVSVVAALPGLGFPDTVEGYTAHANTFVSCVEKYPAMAKELKDYKIIFDIINSNNIILSAKKEIRVPADLRGLKMGGTGATLELYKVLGAAGVFCIPPQTYQKLQTGIVDGTAIHFLAIGEFKAYEVAKYALDISLGQSDLLFVFSRKSWNKVSATDQKIIMEAALEGQNVTYKIGEERSTQGRKAMLDSGGKIHTPTLEETALWEKQFAIMWDKWVSAAEAAGVTNPREILNEWKSASKAAWGK